MAEQVRFTNASRNYYVIVNVQKRNFKFACFEELHAVSTANKCYLAIFTIYLLYYRVSEWLKNIYEQERELKFVFW